MVRYTMAMPLYIDVHKRVEALTHQVEEAHDRDLAVQDKYGVKYLRYWHDAVNARIYCLVEAPSKEAAIAVHKEAHGLVADELVEVDEGFLLSVFTESASPPLPA